MLQIADEARNKIAAAIEDAADLAEDPEGFRAWYLHDWRGDNNTNGLNPEAIIDEWLQRL